MTWTERRQRKEREEKGELQRTGNPGESGRAEEGRRGGNQNHHGTVKRSTLNFKGQSLGISQAAVRGMEQHHPIMDKLGDPGGQTYRQTYFFKEYFEFGSVSRSGFGGKIFVLGSI